MKGFNCLSSVEKDSYDITQKVNELKVKLQKARDSVEKLPGIDLSKEDQEKRIEVLRKQLVAKTELLRKYRNTPIFDLN